MLLVCPNCSARYTLPDEKIGAAGRNVKCAKCSHTWLARLPFGESDSHESEPSANFQTLVQETAQRPKPRTVRPALPPASKKSARWWMPSLPSAALAACLVLVGLVTLSLRDVLLSAMPKSAAFYTLVGFPPDQPLTQISFERFRATVEPSTRGTSALKLDGQLVNRGVRPVTLPPILIKYLGPKSVVIGTQQVTLDKPELAAESLVRVAKTVEGVPAKATAIEVTFVRDIE